MDPASTGETLLAYGPLGAITVAWLFGWVVAKPVNDRERARADRLEQENAALRDRLEKDIIPLLTRAVDVVQGYARDR